MLFGNLVWLIFMGILATGLALFVNALFTEPQGAIAWVVVFAILAFFGSML